MSAHCMFAVIVACLGAGHDQALVGRLAGACCHARVYAGCIQAAGGNGAKGEQQDEAAALREDTLHVRKGVAPGSFLDLLMRAKDRTTGRGFTDLELANQVLCGGELLSLLLDGGIFPEIIFSSWQDPYCTSQGSNHLSPLQPVLQQCMCSVSM